MKTSLAMVTSSPCCTTIKASTEALSCCHNHERSEQLSTDGYNSSTLLHCEVPFRHEWLAARPSQGFARCFQLSSRRFAYVPCMLSTSVLACRSRSSASLLLDCCFCPLSLRVATSLALTGIRLEWFCCCRSPQLQLHFCLCFTYILFNRPSYLPCLAPDAYLAVLPTLLPFFLTTISIIHFSAARTAPSLHSPISFLTFNIPKRYPAPTPRWNQSTH